MTPGIYPNIPSDDYHDGPEMSKGKLDWINDSPARYYWNMTHFTEPTAAMRLGTLTHAVLLEPQLVKIEPTRPALDFRLKANHGARDEHRAAMAEFEADPRPIGCTAEEFVAAKGMADSLRQHRMLRVLLETGEPEVTAYWTDTESGLDCRCRPDWLDLSAHNIAIDIKTTHSIKPRLFAKTMTDFRYHVTQAWYTDGIKAATGQDVTYLFGVVERTPPYLSAVYCLDEEPRDVELGRIEYRHNIATYLECLATHTWPGPVPEEVVSISLPHWVYK